MSFKLAGKPTGEMKNDRETLAIPPVVNTRESFENKMLPSSLVDTFDI